MKKKYGHDNPPPGFNPCTRKRGHAGPCAHPLSLSKIEGKVEDDDGANLVVLAKRTLRQAAHVFDKNTDDVERLYRAARQLVAAELVESVK